MGDSDNSSAALDALRAQFDQAMSEPDTVKRFRVLLDVTDGARHLRSKVDKSLKEHQKSETFLEVEKRFVTKHETKLDALAQGFFNCYATPGKARAALDQLCDNYDTQYVLDVVALGVWRLSKPLGFDLFGIKSEARQVAEAFYEKNLHPALEQAIPDHGDYLKLKRLNVEERYGKVLEDIEMCRKAAAAIEVVLKKYRDRFATEAKSMSEEDVEKLSPAEAVERVKALPLKMQEAIFEAQKEALAAKPRAAH
ncbi:hypothetical protein [Nisaea denitrificans]|uniref:hypothetical protein n=1 Tax=Nisaea denitrificans TaxID=390877 RepID=UPI0004046C34|nr:hypothetical protein [Nisaea denitrificans]